MNKALLVVDVQEFFINKYTNDIPQKITSFIRKHNFVNLYFFKFINNKNSNWYKAGWDKMLNGSETNIVSQLQHLSNSKNTFSKTAFSVFKVNGFDELLKKLNISTLYICGIDTHACIYATALDAYERGYEVKVVSDLCAASHGRKYHKFALDSLSKNLGSNVLISSKEIND